ncbi:zinc finger protein CONSTANS-LIKE 6 isoform X1 [Solanum pennellii]|uniref:Zinc finger protein CONSTANS-LIKE 6 isoform X1 n=2 Tax=Solanum pennellii TaxID=28526 RepID=A0ABM1G8W3_SOLPN|nr:zinc finger protein CONSTANS-LIKE 6 isoform X1 [Solanum pennellii]
MFLLCATTAFVFCSVFDTYKCPFSFIELPSYSFNSIHTKGVLKLFLFVKRLNCGTKMYAETGLMYPYFQTFPSEIQHFEDFCSSHEPNASMGSTISEYDLGGEGDLFKAPQPILEQPLMGLDPMTSAISMISCSEDAISPQGLKVSDLETSFENEQLLSEVFYECKKDLFEKDALSEVLDMKIPIVKADGSLTADENLVSEGSFQKSISSGCLSSMEWIHGAPMRPNFIDFGGMDFGAVYGMRRSFSEGDIKSLGNGNINVIHSPRGQPQISGTSTSDVRKEQLSRYRNKKNKRNFGRKIKYACRKALADSQPRIRGRFAKTEEMDISKKH